MKKYTAMAAVIIVIMVSSIDLNAGRSEMKPAELPADVLEVLNCYCMILSTSPDINICAEKLAAIAGGHLLDSSGKISRDVMEFSLKKDFQNIRFYKVPPVVTRIQCITDDYDGYGETLIQGTRYKIWIAKKDGIPGMPAPIPIIKPATGSPRVVSNIGSL